MIFDKLKETYALSDQGIRGAKWGTFWTCVTNLVTMGGMAALFLAMDAFVKHLTQGAELPGIAPFAIGLVAFFALLFLSNWQQYNYTYNVFYEESGRQRIELAERLRKLPLAFFGRRDLADLTETILGDVRVMEHAYSHVLGELFGAVLSTAIVFVCCLAFNWQLALAAFWSVPVAFAILFATRKPMEPVIRRTRDAAVTVSEGVQETLDCVREIRATNQETHYLNRLNAKIDAAERTTTGAELANGLLVNSSFVVLRLGIATTLICGASLVAAGQVDFMVMFAFLLVVSRIYAPFDQCLMLMAELFSAKNSARRMQEIMHEPLAAGSTDFSPANHDVTFSHVAFSYGAGTDGCAGDAVLTDVSFTAKEGQVTALVGPSGSGKSTCARLAARFWDATAGTVSVGGVDASAVDPETLLKDYAVVFQDVLLFDDTVMGNIRLGRRGATDEEVLAAARAANCDEFVRRLPQGYDTPIGENGSKLSGGERQRISIARALLKDAPIVLLDEATASLDVENETQVQQALSRLLAGKTVIVIAHRMRTVENADHIVVLRDGVVAEQGSPAELKAADGLFAHMVQLQKESDTWQLA
ncbi:ABC transporter ATP-binding protein [Senegalimassilia faecalis]|uniref:ABC transporter ATP-binding protein n=1 Tax=Senegalimassilia faecalis TaxID=2509433 RepID=UPI003A97473A